VNAPVDPRRLRIRLIAGLLLPLVAFLVLRQVLGNATGALAVFPGAVGLACLISLAARRPLLFIVSARLGFCKF
jgi:hypothetical protein